MDNNEIPYHTIRRILKQYIDNDVSRSYVVNVKCFLEETIENIAIASLQELERINQLRGTQSLQKLRRIDGSILLNLMDDLFKLASDVNNDEIGQSNSDTILSEAVEVA